jgi:hypothetical protein
MSDDLGNRIVADRAQAAYYRAKADELERQARKLRREADEIERQLDLARLGAVTTAERGKP